MAVPTYQELMLPVLSTLSERGAMHIRDLAMIVADRLKLSAEDREALLPSGQQLTVVNRTGWACWYLMQASLVSRPKRGHCAITESGKQLLATKPARINLELLEQYPSFVEKIVNRRSSKGDSTKPAEEDTAGGETQTPDERIDAAYLELRETLITELLDQLGRSDPFRFEQIVLDLLVGMGYGGSRKEAAEVTQRSGDEGIDGVINEDRLGLDVIYVQAKRWKANVGRPEIQSFVGALAGKKASKGIFITTSQFHANAKEYAAGLHQKVILIDGRRLAELMIDHNIGVAQERVYPIKRIDSDYFIDDPA